MDFAPYQDNPPETNRCLSSTIPGNSDSAPGHEYTSTIPSTENLLVNPWKPNTFQSEILYNHEAFEDDLTREGPVFSAVERESGRDELNEFETSLSMRIDYEACLAYLLLPPAGSVFLLLIEQKSDYVRYVMIKDLYFKA